MLDNLGRLIGIIFALGFAAFWGYLAYSWNEMGEMGPGQPTVIGLTVLAVVAGVSGLLGLVRMVSSTSSSVNHISSQTSSITPEQRDRDADEIIARYMARREAEGAGGVTPEPAETAPPPSQFGSKEN